MFANNYDCVVRLYLLVHLLICVFELVLCMCVCICLISACILCLSRMFNFTCVAWVAFAFLFIAARIRRDAVEGTCAALSTAINRLVLPSAAC